MGLPIFFPSAADIANIKDFLENKYFSTQILTFCHLVSFSSSFNSLQICCWSYQTKSIKPDQFYNWHLVTNELPAWDTFGKTGAVSEAADWRDYNWAN